MAGTAPALTRAFRLRPTLRARASRTGPAARLPLAALLLVGISPWSAAQEDIDLRVRSSAAVVAEGACRDGVPNGAYRLHDTQGHTLASGAFHVGRRAGTFVFWNAAGARLAVVPYDEDRRTGTVALWHADARGSIEGTRALEMPYVDGVMHGVARAWDARGRPRAQFRFERGLLAEAQAWDGRGRPLSPEAAQALARSEISRGEARYAALERLVARHPPSCP